MSALLSQTTIAAAAAGVTPGPVIKIPRRCVGLLLEGRFLYGSGGTTMKAWVQTRVSGGTWRDIANFAFTTAAATKFHGVSTRIAVAAAIVASDAALADDTILNGFLGDELRVNYTSTGTYAGATSLAIDVTVRE